MKKLIFVIIFIFTGIIYSQTDGPSDYGDWLTSPRYEFYSENILSAVSSGKGFTGIGSVGDLSLLNLNPASVNIDKKFQVYAGYTYKTGFKLNGYYSQDNDMNSYFPCFFAGSVYRINKDFQVGLVYRNEYSFKYKYKLSSSSEISYSLATHTFTIPVNYSYRWIRAGMNLNLTYFRGDANNFSTEINPEGFKDAHSSLWRIIPQFGFIVTPAPFISFGATYTPQFTDSTKWYVSDTAANSLNAPVRYPHRFGIGTEVRLMNNKLKFSFDFHFERTSILYMLKDKFTYNFGIEYALENDFIIRGGFYAINDYNDFSGTIVTNLNKYGLYFLTIGSTYKYKNISFNIALMESYLSNIYDAAHAKIIGGVGFDF